MGVIKKLPIYLENIPGGGIAVTSLETLLLNLLPQIFRDLVHAVTYLLGLWIGSVFRSHFLSLLDARNVTTPQSRTDGVDMRQFSGRGM